jgi:HIRAN domain
MGLLRRLSPRRQSARSSLGISTEESIVIHVCEDTHAYEANDGKTIWCGGYGPTDKEGLYLRESDYKTSDPRAFFCHVAGVTFRPDALTKKCFAHGSPVALRAEPNNPKDENAVAVYDASGKVQVGYVPAAPATTVAAVMHSGVPLVGFVLREYRAGSQHGKRLGIHIAILPAGQMELFVHDD